MLRRLFLAFLISCLASTAIAEKIGPAAWIEITPLASQAEAVVTSVAAKPGPVSIVFPGTGSGLALVCVGGEKIAVTCEQRFLDGPGTVDPAPRLGVKTTGVLRLGRNPLEGARLSLVPKDLRSRRFLTLPLSRDEKTGKLVREVTSDRQGRFTIPPLSPGSYLLEMRAPGGKLLHQELAVPPREKLLPKGPRAADAEAVLDLGEIRLDEGISVAVFVTGPGGQPLPGARVGGGQGDRPEDTVFYETVADAQGKAVLSGLAPGVRMGVTCLAEGHAAWRQMFDSPPASVGCALEPLSSLHGSVVDLDGKPVRGATVAGPSLEQPVGLGARGTFELRNLGAGEHRFTVAAPGYEPASFSATLAAGEDRGLDPIELRPGREWRGLVRDAATRKPIPAATLIAVEPPGAVTAASGPEGEFTFTAGGERGGDPLRIRVSAENYAEADFNFPGLEPDDEGQLVLDLQRGGRIRAAVWDEETGAPCQGCGVLIQTPGADIKKLITDGRGEALSGPLPEGRHSVSLEQVQSLGGVVQVRGGANQRWADVRSGETALVRFGEPTEEVLVHFRPPVPEGWMLTADSDSGSRIAERLPDGAFRVRRPTAGPVTLRLGFNGGSVRQVTLSDQDRAPALDLPLPQTRLSGTLTGEDNPANRLLRFVGNGDATVRATVMTQADGSFALSFLPPGVYTIFLDGKPLQSFRLETDANQSLGEVKTAP